MASYSSLPSEDATAADSEALFSWGGEIEKESHDSDVQEKATATKANVESESRISLIWIEMRKQFILAGPMALSNILSFSIQVVSLMFMGHLGEKELSGASLAISFAGVTGFTFMIGLSSGLETLCGQAFGAKRYHLLGIYTQTSVIVLYGVCIPIAFLWFNMEPFLLAVGQDKDLSRVAAHYMRWLLPSLFASALVQPLARFLQTQSIVMPTLVCSFLALIIHVCSCYTLVYYFDLGVRAGAIAGSISWWCLCIMLLGYALWPGVCEKTWNGLSWEAFKGWKVYLKIAFPSACMICLEYWCFEIVVLVAGLLPNPQLEVSLLAISLNTAALAYMIPFGLGGAASTRVSNELGAQRPDAAKLAVQVVMGISTSVAAVIGTCLVLFRHVWVRAFTNVEEVAVFASSMMPLIAISCCLDGVQAILSGVVRGCGWQELGAYVNLGAYYVVGLPCALLFGFVFHFRSKGLWCGLICALAVQNICLLFVTLRTNWVKMSEDAANRVKGAEVVEPLLLTYGNLEN